MNRYSIEIIALCGVSDRIIPHSIEISMNFDFATSVELGNTKMSARR
jgi:hypothetical protein